MAQEKKKTTKRLRAHRLGVKRTRGKAVRQFGSFVPSSKYGGASRRPTFSGFRMSS